MQWTRPKGRAAAPEVAEWRHCEFDTVHIFPASQTDVVIASSTTTSSSVFFGRADGGLPSATPENLPAQSFNPNASGAMTFDGRILIVHAELVEDDVGAATPVWITISDLEGDSLGESRVDAVAFPLELASPASRLATECVCFSVHIPLVLLAQCIMVAGILFLHEHCS